MLGNFSHPVIHKLEFSHTKDDVVNFFFFVTIVVFVHVVDIWLRPNYYNSVKKFGHCVYRTRVSGPYLDNTFAT